jgi:magnesium chelatase family protein
MLSLAFTAALSGVDAHIVRVEADIASGLPSFALVGLPDRATLEARERVRAAIVNSGFVFPPGRLLAHVAASNARGGAVASSDVAIALGLLAADDQIARAQLRDYVVCGELALDGAIRSVPGVLAMALAAKQAGFERILVPEGNGPEAALVEGLDVFAVPSLADAVTVILGQGARFRARASSAGAVPTGAEGASCGDFFGRARSSVG